MGDDKEHGRLASVIVPIIVAVIGAVAVLGGAIFSNWDKLFPQKPPTQVLSGLNTTAAPSTDAKVRPSHSLFIPLKTKGPLFIVAPPGTEGASISARILNSLHVEGFQIANGRDGAKLLIEIQAPSQELPQAAAANGLDSFSVVTTLAAKVFPRSDGTGDVIPVQRQALGVGATEIEARRNSIAAATDRLSKSIIDTLR